MIACIIQARMASSRLPGKVLLDIAGKPMLQWVVARAGMAETVDEVVVATTSDPSDDPIAAFCQAQGYPFTRGSMHDVLDRYIQAARAFKADVVVRVTADCPLLDPGLLDTTVHLLAGTRYLTPGTAPLDFVTNRLPPPWGRTFPIGLDVEVVTVEALERAWREAREKHHREHVMPYFYDDLPDDAFTRGDVMEHGGAIESGPTKDPGSRLPADAAHPGTRNPEPGTYFSARRTSRGFHIALLNHHPDYGHLRWTVDTPEDLEAVRRLAEHLPETFNWLNALEIWQSHPEIAALNASIRHKTARDTDPRA